MSFVADYFKKWTKDRLETVHVQPPYDVKDALWVRGSLRYKREDDSVQDLIVTGPKMKICYSGSKWNRIVLAMNGTEDVYQFEMWLRHVAEYVRSAIWADPSRFRKGATSNLRFVFDDDVVKPSKDSMMYPDELRCRLSTRRETNLSGDPVDVVDAFLFTRSDLDGATIQIDPSDIAAGSYIIPVIKISYNRTNDRFGLVCTVLQGLIFPSDGPRNKIDNSEWVIDTSSMDI